MYRQKGKAIVPDSVFDEMIVACQQVDDDPANDDLRGCDLALIKIDKCTRIGYSKSYNRYDLSASAGLWQKKQLEKEKDRKNRSNIIAATDCFILRY
jgi:hypothetical protein